MSYNRTLFVVDHSLITLMDKTLYDQDFQQWITVTIEQLRSQDFVSLDTEHLIEELEDLSKSEKSQNLNPP